MRTCGEHEQPCPSEHLIVLRLACGMHRMGPELLLLWCVLSHCDIKCKD